MLHVWLILAGLFLSVWVLRQIPGSSKQPPPPPIVWVLVLAITLAFTAWVWTGSPPIVIGR